MSDYIPIVNHPITPKPPKSKHTGGNSGGHVKVSVAKVARPKGHLRAAAKPKAPKKAHAASKAKVKTAASTYAVAEAAAEKSDGLDITGIVGSTVDVNQNTDGTMGVYTGPSIYAIEQANNQAMQKQNLVAAIASGANVSSAQKRQFHIPVAQLAKTPKTTKSRTAVSASKTATPKAPAAPKVKKIAAPLALTDSGLQGHDSHISHPQTLTPVPPVTNRRNH